MSLLSSIDHRSIGGQLLDASFGIDFTKETSNTSGMLNAIDRVIITLKRDKCNELYENKRYCDIYDSQTGNEFLPTREELYQQEIYLNGRMIKIGDIKDEFEYKIT